MNTAKVAAIKDCESILLEVRDGYIKAGIYPNDVASINFLLSQQAQMQGVYEEISMLSAFDRRIILEQLGVTMVDWSPKAGLQMIADRDRLIEVNEKISELANSLSILLDERHELENTTSFESGAHHHNVNVIKEASRENYHYRNFLAKPLESLKGQFDLKYWPPMSSAANFTHEIRFFEFIRPDDGRLITAFFQVVQKPEIVIGCFDDCEEAIDLISNPPVLEDTKNVIPLVQLNIPI
jgi:hypothetical protein